MLCLLVNHGKCLLLTIRINTEIQDGNWNTARDHMSSMYQRLCWDTGDTLGWGEAPGRAETSALWTPTSWKASLHHDLLKEQPVLLTKSHPIGLPILWPVPQPHQGSHPSDLHNLCWDHAPQACQVSDLQAHTISTPPDLFPSGMSGPHSKGLLQCLKHRLLPAGPWDTTYLPPAKGGLQTCLGDTDKSRC
jgi:hypothetical protein